MRYTRAQIVDGTGFPAEQQFETVEDYNGWTNRETWAVALHINNDQGWQESVHEALRAADVEQWNEQPNGGMAAWRAGQIVKDNVEETLLSDDWDNPKMQRDTLNDIGSLYRVNWDEIGAAFLTDVQEAGE